MPEIPENWRLWLNQIEIETTKLVVSKHYFEEYRRIVLENLTGKSLNEFHRWILRNYLESSTLAVRRLVDRRGDSISLVRLLDEIRKMPSGVSRANYLRGWQSGMEYIGNAEFDAMAGTNAEHLPVSVVEADCASIRDITKDPVLWANKFFAHYDSKRDDTLLASFNTLHVAIGELESVLLKYKRLITGAAQDSLLPTWQYYWQDVFDEPWNNGAG